MHINYVLNLHVYEEEGCNSGKRHQNVNYLILRCNTVK